MPVWHVCLVRKRHRLHTGSAFIGADVESPRAELTAIKKEWQRQNCQRENDDSWIEVHRSLGGRVPLPVAITRIACVWTEFCFEGREEVVAS